MSDFRSKYEEVRATRTMRGIPRFGHSSEFAYITGTQQQQQDYIKGLLFAGIFVLCFYFAWTILILIFKILGQKRVGFLSGSPFQVLYGSKKPMIIRTTFLLAAITLIVFTALLVSEGITEVERGINTLNEESQNVDEIIGQVYSYLQTVDETRQVGISLRDELISQLNSNEFCPSGNLTTETGTNFDVIIENVTTFLSSLRNFSQAKIDDAQMALDTASNTCEDFVYTTDNITSQDWQSLIFIVPGAFFFVILVGAVLLAWAGRSFKWFTRLNVWLVLPLFFIWIVFCWICCGAVAIAASANADFCSGGIDNTPGGSIIQIMQTNGFTKEDLILLVVRFYIYQCPTTDSNPLDSLNVFASELRDANATVAEFSDAIEQTTIDTIIQICGQSDIQTIANLLQNFGQSLVQIVNGLDKILDLLSCDIIVPLYTRTFFTGTCNDLVTGATWTFSALLVISMMGLLMITFRSSWHPTEFVEEGKFASAPIEYVEEHEAANEPHQLEKSPQDAEMSWDDGPQNTGVAVVTGVSAGAAIDEATKNDDESFFNESGGKNAIKASDKNDGDDPTKAFDDRNWLEISA